MDPRVTKMNHRLSNMRLAQKLVKADFATPKLIKAASDEQLLAIPSIDAEDVQTIRERIG